jgi:SHOCT-like protein
MTVSREERNRILVMVEAGQVSAEDAAQLLDALVEEPPPAPPIQSRTVRVWVTDMATRSRKVNLTATLPVNVLRISLQALESLVPPLRDGRAEQIVRSLESGATGRVMDLQDLEDGKRVEIFIEQ